MKIQVFIFNYELFEKACALLQDFTNIGLDTYLINCKSDKDPKFSQTKKIIKIPNLYWAGQWNKSLEIAKKSDSDIIFFIDSDVIIKNKKYLIKRMAEFYSEFQNSAIYAPNVYWTPWTFNPKLLREIKKGIFEVPSTDTTIWSVRKEIALEIGPINLNINKFGWKTEILASYLSKRKNKLVVRDYKIKCLHPDGTKYDRDSAEKFGNDWIEKILKEKYKKEFFDLCDSVGSFGFGCDDINCHFGM